jgi:hypothetical protein
VNCVETAMSYLRAGLCPLPVRLDTKRPMMRRWKPFQEHLPNEQQIQAFFAECEGVCLVTGRATGEEGLDFDNAGEMYQPWFDAIEARAPGLLAKLVIERSRGGGRHVYYRTPGTTFKSKKLATRVVPAPSKEKVIVNGKTYEPKKVGDHYEFTITLIETRGEKSIIVCAPTPGYVLEQGSFENIPVITLEEREILIETACLFNEHIPTPKAVPAVANAVEGRPGDDFNQRGDVRDLLVKHGWTLVRQSENEYWRRPGKDEGWSATLKNGVFYVFTTSAEPFEGHTAYSPFSVYTLLEHNGNYGQAAAALRSQGYGSTEAPVNLSHLMPEPTPEEAPPSRPEDPGPFPPELLENLPDIVKRAFDYYKGYAFETQPVLFLGSLIAATGTVLGHKVRDVSGLRTNVYTVGITGSGGGKEATREVIRRIFDAAGLTEMCGPEDFASDTGLIGAVEVQNPILFQLDEFGRLMQSINVSSNRNPHLYNVASVLLKLYGKAGSIYRSKAYADTERNKTIVQPHVCVYGTTVNSNFWRAMDLDYLEGGFLPRLVLFESQNDPMPGGATEGDPPIEVVEYFRQWANFNPAVGNLTNEFPQPRVVQWTDAGKALLDALHERQRRECKEHDELGVLWSRARENAGKLALIHACWRQSGQPEIDAPDVQWATSVITHSIQHAMYQAFMCMSEGPFHERCQRIMRLMEKAGDQEVSRSDLTRGTRNMTPRERDEALQTLIEQGWLQVRTEGTAGRSGCYYRKRS